MLLQLILAHFEVVILKVGGLKKYMNDKSNLMDIVFFILLYAHSFFKIYFPDVKLPYFNNNPAGNEYVIREAYNDVVL